MSTDKARKAAEEHATLSYFDADGKEKSAGTHPIKYNSYLEGVAWALANPGWIKCSERMPEEYKTVLVMLLGNETPAYGFRFGFGSTLWGVCDDAGDFTQYLAHQVTHWLALPPAPEGE